ncbi:MAG: phosphoribosylformylglycinamidine cyclo-ligase [Bacteriovorax sp.]|nr:phosphoribosylformylglycinamidine cyclo-ligase [Bacteriovorax sp.]
MVISYKDSGVDIEKGDLFVERISKMVRSTYNQQVVSGVGGFCALYALDPDRYLASSTDGVGTKIKLAIELGMHETIGIDLVAMCVNDLICSGARPLFFLDYFASSKLDLEVSEAVLKGIVDGCLQSQMALIGGETAEMPGMYQIGDYDLAGFSVGEVKKSELIDGLSLTEGDSLVAIASTGFHSNGYSLVRKILETKGADETLKKECLTPTKIYVKTILSLINSSRINIKGVANITGSGFLNIPRINEKFDYHVSSMGLLPPFMEKVCELSALDEAELHRTFNMGVGMVVATDNPKEIIKKLEELGEKAYLIGNVTKGSGKIFLKEQEL